MLQYWNGSSSRPRKTQWLWHGELRSPMPRFKRPLLRCCLSSPRGTSLCILHQRFVTNNNGDLSLLLRTRVTYSGDKGISATQLTQKMEIDSKSMFYYVSPLVLRRITLMSVSCQFWSLFGRQMIPLLKRGLVVKCSEVQSRVNSFKLFRYSDIEPINNNSKTISQLVDILRKVPGNAIVSTLLYDRTEESQ